MLSNNDVHLWHTSLAVPSSRLASCLQVLSADERERARRYRFDCHRNRFIVARAFMRSLLGYYTGRDPGALEFEVSEYGKPMLADPGGLCFNLSHSDDVAVCAIAKRRVGVDIERLRPMSDLLAIAELFFSPSEVAALRSVEPGELTRRFFTCWTRKEAYIKAEGRGLSLSLRAFAVSLDPALPELFHMDGDPDAPNRWVLSNVVIHDDFVGALATESPRPEVTLLRWRDADS
jgi:4'-phosphopantetheinyl transferase